MADFASTIKRLRTERGVTQEQLAAMLNVSRSTIGMYETGSREPDFETCEGLITGVRQCPVCMVSP